MKQSLFEQRHQAAWQRFDKRLAFLEKARSWKAPATTSPPITGASANNWRWPRSAATAVT